MRIIICLVFLKNANLFNSSNFLVHSVKDYGNRIKQFMYQEAVTELRHRQKLWAWAKPIWQEQIWWWRNWKCIPQYILPDLYMRSEPARSTIISLLFRIMEGFNVLPEKVILPFSFVVSEFLLLTDLLMCTCNTAYTSQIKRFRYQIQSCAIYSAKHKVKSRFLHH